MRIPVIRYCPTETTARCPAAQQLDGVGVIGTAAGDEQFAVALPGAGGVVTAHQKREGWRGQVPFSGDAPKAGEGELCRPGSGRSKRRYPARSADGPCSQLSISFPMFLSALKRTAQTVAAVLKGVSRLASGSACIWARLSGRLKVKVTVCCRGGSRGLLHLIKKSCMKMLLLFQPEGFSSGSTYGGTVRLRTIFWFVSRLRFAK